MSEPLPTGPPSSSEGNVRPSRPSAARSDSRWGVGTWLRLGLGVLGLGALVFLVVTAGVDTVIATLKPAWAWLPLLCALELGRVGSETIAAWIAFGEKARLVPKLTLFRANLVGQALANLAPAPRVVNETIKATLIAPYVGVPAATSVGVAIQASTLTSVGLFSIPCGIALFVLGGASVWFWAALIHAIVLVASGVALRGVTRARGPGRWLGKKFPKLAPGTEEFADHARGIDLLAVGPTFALLGNRLFQTLQLSVAANAVGAKTDTIRALAAQGVNLVANAVGVLVPGGLGTTDGAFTLAAETLGTTVAKATALALLIRCTQLFWLLVGSIVLVAVPRPRVPATTDVEVDA